MNGNSRLPAGVKAGTTPLSANKYLELCLSLLLLLLLTQVTGEVSLVELMSHLHA